MIAFLVLSAVLAILAALVCAFRPPWSHVGMALGWAAVAALAIAHLPGLAVP